MQQIRYMINEKVKTKSFDYAKTNGSYYNAKVGDVCYRFNRFKREEFFRTFPLCVLFLLSQSFLRESTFDEISLQIIEEYV